MAAAAAAAASDLVAASPGAIEGPTKPSVGRLLQLWLFWNAVATAVTAMRTATTCSAILACLMFTIASAVLPAKLAVPLSLVWSVQAKTSQCNCALLGSLCAWLGGLRFGG